MHDNVKFEDIKTLTYLLSHAEIDEQMLYAQARSLASQHCGEEVYLRGLVEISNICRKNCLYCGLRRSNDQVKRFMLTESEILDAVLFAYEQGFGSVVLQSGEQHGFEFVRFVERIIKLITQKTNNQLTITLSCGEQKEETYQRWYEAGASRYLLRIETSDPLLYSEIHPKDEIHSYNTRKECLFMLRDIGYQVGTGVMIGLPGQTTENLAQDLLFMKEQDIDMCGMGPYIVHPNTPMAKNKDKILSPEQRLKLSLRMIALLRILMKNINIASTTALETLHPEGRLLGLLAGANVFMPNLTPVPYQEKYSIYAGKPTLHREQVLKKIKMLEKQLLDYGLQIAWNKPGNPIHYQLRNKNDINIS